MNLLESEKRVEKKRRTSRSKVRKNGSNNGLFGGGAILP